MGLYSTFHITGIREETASCKTFFLERNNDPLDYQAGQFLTFVFAGLEGEERRSYSISSAPLLQEPLSITVKRLENGQYSRLLLDKAVVGDTLTSTGAAGFFVLPENMRGVSELFFMAAGSGISPVLPLIKTVLYLHPHIRVVLIYSNRSVAETIFLEHLQQLAFQFGDRFQLLLLFSDARDLTRARLSKGLMAELLHAMRRAAVNEILFYTCGPFDYMRMVTIALLENQVPLQHIRKESFVPMKMHLATLPPDTHMHAVTIAIGTVTKTLNVQYPQTILSAARQAGLTLPYSCESGRCGSCAATCMQGKVWMSYNEVLMDDEIEKGRVLTCVGYPIEGDVQLKFF